jgi:plastocyanin
MKSTRFSIVIFIFAIATLLLASAGLLSAAPPADASGSGSFTGTVKFDGIPPKQARIDMSPYPDCAKEHPTPVTAEDILTGAGDSLANVIVYVSDGLSGRTFNPPDQPAVLEQKGCMYRPHVIALQAGQKLEVRNEDKTTHNIHPIPANNREWNKMQPPAVPFEESFAREEIAIPVKCNVHPWMRGYIAVFKHPYFAVTDKNGSFELKDLPPGSYTITAWHEKLGTKSQKVTVSAGQAGKLEFVFKQ